MPYATRSKTKPRIQTSSSADVEEPDLPVDDRQSDYTSGAADEEYDSEDYVIKTPKKRSVTSAAAKGKGKGKASDPPPKRRRVAGKLSVLPTMPMDILFEIFGHLDPQDLVRLSRTSKAFRQVLLSTESGFLWKDVFAKSDGPPPCPEDVTELAWANLLFGGTYCQNCGAKGVKKILFELRRRLCQKCISFKLLSWSDIPREFYSINRRLLSGIEQALPCSGAKVKSGTYAFEVSYFNREDVRSLISDYREACNVQQDLDHDEVASKFLRDREDKMRALHKHAQDCHRWENERAAARGVQLADARQARRQKIIEKIEALGYTEDDARYIWKTKGASTKDPLTDRAWERLFPAIKENLDLMKASRLAQEKRERQMKRHELIIEAYHIHLKKQPSKDIPLLPTLDQSLLFPPLHKLAVEDIETVTEQWHQDLEKAIPEAFSLMLAKLDENIKTLVAKLPLNDFRVHDPIEELPGSECRAVLARATSAWKVSYCWTPGTKFGLGVLVQRSDTYPNRVMYLESLQKYGPPDNIQYWPLGRTAVLHVLSRLDKDENTTAEELDIADERFMCLTCVLKDRVVYTWREAVSHAADEHKHSNEPDKLSSDLNLRVLMPGERELVRAREGIAGAAAAQWGCCHCSTQLDLQPAVAYTNTRLISWKTLDAIQVHLEEIHGIKSPRNMIDYFWNPANSSPETYCDSSARMKSLPDPFGV